MTELPSPTPKKPDPTSKRLWQEAEDALLRAAHTLSAEHKRDAANKLYLAYIREATAHIRQKVDVHLPASKRRDADEMAQDVVGSLMVGKARVSVLAEEFDPERASLRTLLGLYLSQKVMDYVRKNPRDGIVGGTKKAQLAEQKAQAPQGSTGTLNSLADFCSSLGDESEKPLDGQPQNPMDFGAAATSHPSSLLNNDADLPSGPRVAPSGVQGPAMLAGSHAIHQDDHITRELLMRIQAELSKESSKGEWEVFECELAEMTQEEAVNYLNAKHGHGTISLSTYKRRLESARLHIFSRFPEVKD